MITVWRIILAGSRNFLRNAWLSTAATAVMTLTLSIILTSFIANKSLTATIKSIVNKIDVSIYLKDTTTQPQTADLQKRLNAVDNVQSVKYVSKQEAFDRFRGQHKNDTKLIEGIDQLGINALPASFEVKMKDQKRLDPITAFVNQGNVRPLLDDKNPTSYQGDRKATIDRIIKASNFFKTAGLVASLLFVVISTLIIFNTIRMAIFTRRDEIEIMKLVGATNWFIRGPFIFEACLYGIIAALIAIFLSYSLLLTGGPRLGSYIDVISTINFFKAYPLLIFGAELAIGILIGTASSLLAMIRYLKL